MSDEGGQPRVRTVTTRMLDFLEPRAPEHRWGTAGDFPGSPGGSVVFALRTRELGQ